MKKLWISTVVVVACLFCTLTNVSAQNPGSIYWLNASGTSNVAFFTSGTSPNWAYANVTLTYQDNTTSTHSAYRNAFGNPQILVPISCSKKVKKAIFYITWPIHYATTTQYFVPRVCGSSWFE